MAQLPSIIIAGFQKCGTSALFRILLNHPGIRAATRLPADKNPPGPKELHFFNRDDSFARGLGWYAAHFEDGPELAMEATPEYASFKKSIRRMAQNLPGAKIILLMRDPIERAFSAWNHWKQLEERGGWSMPLPDASFDANVREEIHRQLRGLSETGLVGRGFYIQLIEYLDQFYPPEQIYIGYTSDLRDCHTAEIERIQKFLGIEVRSLESVDSHSRNYKVPPMKRSTRTLLGEIYRPFDERLQKRVGRPLPWGRAGTTV